jgi:predicted transcriptional regulator
LISIQYSVSKVQKVYQYSNPAIVGYFRGKKMARRTRLEVLSSILEICSGEGASKTRIVYQINLNFKNAGVYLKWLTDKGYLVKEGKMYKITPAGKEMLLGLKEICSILNIEEHMTEDKV